MSDRIMRIAEVQDALGGIGKTTLYRWIEEGEFPKPLRVGGDSSRTIGWLESDVDAYLQAKRQEAMAS